MFDIHAKFELLPHVGDAVSKYRMNLFVSYSCFRSVYSGLDKNCQHHFRFFIMARKWAFKSATSTIGSENNSWCIAKKKLCGKKGSIYHQN
jgi:hypothetical protein